MKIELQKLRHANPCIGVVGLEKLWGDMPGEIDARDLVAAGRERGVPLRYILWCLWCYDKPTYEDVWGDHLDKSDSTCPVHVGCEGHSHGLGGGWEHTCWCPSDSRDVPQETWDCVYRLIEAMEAEEAL